MATATFHTLSNGLRTVHLHNPRSAAAYFGIAIKAGSVNETTQAEAGLAHFVEHTIFKGTAKRSSWHIINRMEAVGGELNAFTTKEDTGVYSSFPKGALSRAMELIADLIVNSRFPQNEIDKEREVICDEINSYLDIPSEAVYDEFEDYLYAGMPLGHNILGTLDSVRAIDSDMCRQWIERHYTAPNMVAFYAGPCGADTFLRKAERLLRDIPAEAFPTIESNTWMPAPPFDIKRRHDSHQAHTVMGTALPKLDVKNRMTLALLTNILGGPGMNSLFNVDLRERRGLVYNVESTLSNWQTSSMFTTYFGTDPDDNTKCIKLVNDIISNIADKGLTPSKFSAAKKQYLGQLILARENTENRVIGLARSLLLHGYTLTAAQVRDFLAQMTVNDIKTMAARLVSLSSLSLTPNP